MIDLNKHCSQLDYLRAAIETKYSKLVNKKEAIFHEDNTGISFDNQAKMIILVYKEIEASTKIPVFT